MYKKLLLSAIFILVTLFMVTGLNGKMSNNQTEVTFIVR